MKKGFQILSLLFLLAWLIGYFVFHTGMSIHVCLATALLCFIQSVITITAVVNAAPKPEFN